MDIVKLKQRQHEKSIIPTDNDPLDQECKDLILQQALLQSFYNKVEKR